MGYDFEARTPTLEAERAEIEKIISGYLADHYTPWEGPGLDVQKADGSWTFLKVRLDGNDIVVAGFKGEHRLQLTAS